MDIQAIKESILEATILVFNEKGLKFTMDDIAGKVGMSKKTIYTVFCDKETLFLETVDFCFDKIKASEEEVLKDETHTTVQKIRRILGVLPEGYRDIDYQKLYILKDKFPKIYQKVEQRLESGWESTIQLLEQGMREGSVRKINIPVYKLMLEATIEQFFQRDVLIQNGLYYSEALEEVVNILVDGIIVQ